MTDRKLTPATREDVIQAIQHGMLFDGRKRSHHWDSINAQVAAEKLAGRTIRADTSGPDTSRAWTIAGTRLSKRSDSVIAKPVFGIERR